MEEHKEDSNPGLQHRGQVASWHIAEALEIIVALEAHHQDSTAMFSR